MKNIFKSFALVAAMFTAASCNLDLYPDNALPYDPADPMIKSIDDLISYETGIYANFRSLQSGGYKMADDFMFDGFNATQSYGNRYGGLHRCDESFTSGDEYVEGFWRSCYIALKNINVTIEQIQKTTLDKDEYKDELAYVDAEAKFARAWIYLQLARRFGAVYGPDAATDLCVPIVLVYDQNARPARNTVKEVYDQILADLNAAYEVLGAVPGASKSEEFTKDAVHFVYANYYLDIKDYKKSLEYAEKVLNNSAYAFAEKDAEFQAEWFSDGGKEAIMLLPASKKELTGGYGEYTNYGADSNSPTKDAYASGYLPSKKLLDLYETKDLRYKNWFDNTSTIPFSINGDYKMSKFYVFVKYKGNVELSSNGAADAHIAPKPFALPEICLIAAEAACKDNNALVALKYLKKIQNARNATPSAQATMEEIQKEWFKETVGDGLRMICLKRWGIGYDGREGQTGALDENVLMTGAAFTEHKLEAGDYHFSWPIPSYEIRVNPNLKQNKGYSSSQN